MLLRPSAQFDRLLSRVDTDLARTRSQPRSQRSGGGDVYFTPLSAQQTPAAPSPAATSSSFPVAALTFATAAGDDDGALGGGAAVGTPQLFRARSSPLPPPGASGAPTPHTVSPQPLPLAAGRQHLQQLTWQQSSGGGAAGSGPGFKAAMDRVWARVSAMEMALQTLTARPAV